MNGAAVPVKLQLAVGRRTHAVGARDVRQHFGAVVVAGCAAAHQAVEAGGQDLDLHLAAVGAGEGGCRGFDVFWRFAPGCNLSLLHGGGGDSEMLDIEVELLMKLLTGFVGERWMKQSPE